MSSQEFIVRPARSGDEPHIASVHIQTWQEAYEGIIPQDYLDRLPSELTNRIENWKKTLVNPQRWAWVAEDPSGIVGFIVFGLPRDKNRVGFIELGAIYLLASKKGKGVGFSLLSTGFNHMKNLGYDRAYCWVLEGNPTIKFYEGSGAIFNGQTKSDEVGGKAFKELMYEWTGLELQRNEKFQFLVTMAQDYQRAAEDFYQNCGRKTELSPEDTLVVALHGQQIAGLVRLCSEDGEHVLRTMQVHPDFQRKGLGSNLLKNFDRLLSERAIGEIYCMPYDYLEQFYGQIGFKKIGFHEAPQFLRDRVTKFASGNSEQKAILMKRVTS